MLTSLVPRDLLSDYHFLALPCTQCVPADIYQRHSLPSRFSGCPGGVRPTIVRTPQMAHFAPSIERGRASSAGRCMGFPAFSGHSSGCVHVGLHTRVRQHEHYQCMLSPTVGIHRHSPAGAPGGVVRFLYADPCQAGPLDSRVWTLCSSPAQFEAASPFRPIAGEAELECFLSNKLRLLVPEATERICLDRGFRCRRGVNALSCFCLYTRYPHHTRAYGWSLCRPGGS